MSVISSQLNAPLSNANRRVRREGERGLGQWGFEKDKVRLKKGHQGRIVNLRSKSTAVQRMRNPSLDRYTPRSPNTRLKSRSPTSPDSFLSYRKKYSLR